MARKHLKAGALTAPLPPVLVTVGDMEKSNIITVAWTGILATIPPRTYVSIRPSRHSHAMLRESGEFVINLPSANLVREVDYIGIYTGAKVDKFSECGLHKCKSEQVSAPTIEECPVALECRVTSVESMGTHDVFFADIVGVSCDESILDEQGKMRFERANLLAYAHGEYYSLGEKLASFGHSATKEKKGGSRGAGKPASGARSTSKPAEKRSADASSARGHTEKPMGEKGAKPDTGAAVKPKGGEKSPRTEVPAEQSAHTKTENEKKPFYLTAPRGKGKKSGKRGQGR